MIHDNINKSSNERKVKVNIDYHSLLSEVEEYCRYSLELGASDAVIISENDIVFDKRVLLKCIYPKCRWYGTNINCPPYALESSKIEEAIKEYRLGIFYRIRVPAADFTGNPIDPKGLYKSSTHQYLNHKIASLVESRAFHDGYPFAFSLGGGPCKPLFCPDQECAAMDKGKGCRAPLKARSALEAVGISAYKMAQNAGWDVYPCGAKTKIIPPHGTCLGLILID